MLWVKPSLSVIDIKNSEVFSALQVERLFWNRVRAHLNVYHRYVFNFDTPIQSPYSCGRPAKPAMIEKAAST